jgi:hypothetical protein
LNAAGTVASEQKISETTGGFGGALDSSDFFGCSVVSPGDLDDDGHTDLAVGAHFDDDGDSEQGAVWILFLNSDGTVASERKISETMGGFGGVLDPDDAFGISLAALGDLDGDGNEDLAVGAAYADDGAGDQGAVWMLFLEGPQQKRPRFVPGLDAAPGVERSKPSTLPLTTSPERVARLGPPIGELRGSARRPRDGRATVRKGSEVNERCFSGAGPPRAGGEWQAWIDVSAHHARASLVLVSERPLRGRATPYGELLIDIVKREPLFTSLVHSSGATDVHTFSIPPALLGRSFSLQALILERRGGTLTNAIDIVVGQ